MIEHHPRFPASKRPVLERVAAGSQNIPPSRTTGKLIPASHEGLVRIRSARNLLLVVGDRRISRGFIQRKMGKNLPDP